MRDMRVNQQPAGRECVEGRGKGKVGACGKGFCQEIFNGSELLDASAAK